MTAGRLAAVLLAGLLALPATAGEPARVVIEEWQVPYDPGRPRDPDVAGADSIWFVGQKTHYLAHLRPSSGRFTRRDLGDGSGPHNLIVGADGIVWYAGNRRGYIGRFDPRTDVIEKIAMPDSAARDPHTLVFDRDQRHIWFTVQWGNLVGRLRLADRRIDLIPVPTEDARPYGIVVAPDGSPWIALLGTHKLASVDPETLKLTEHELPELDAAPPGHHLGRPGLLRRLLVRRARPPRSQDRQDRRVAGARRQRFSPLRPGGRPPRPGLVRRDRGASQRFRRFRSRRRALLFRHSGAVRRRLGAAHGVPWPNAGDLVRHRRQHHRPGAAGRRMSRAGVLAGLLLALAAPVLAQQPMPQRVTLGTFHAWCERGDTARATAYVAGAADMANSYALAFMLPGICLPAGADDKRLTEAACTYARAHPELHHLVAAAHVRTALREAFPCPSE